MANRQPIKELSPYLRSLQEKKNTNIKYPKKRTSVIYGIDRLHRIEEAYKARARFLITFNKNPLLFNTIIKKFKLNPSHKTKYEIKIGNNSPAINIYLDYNEITHHALAERVYIPGIGIVYINIMFNYQGLEDKDLVNSFSIHEEDHTNTKLSKKMNTANIKSITDIKKITISELLAYLAQITNNWSLQIDYSNNKEAYDQLQQNVLNTYSEITMWSNLVPTNQRYKIPNQIKKIFQYIYFASKYLSSREIGIVIRQTHFDKIIPTLQQRIKDHKKYTKKSLN